MLLNILMYGTDYRCLEHAIKRKKQRMGAGC